MAKIKECQMKYDKYMKTLTKDMWLSELDEFLEAYALWQKEWALSNEDDDNNGKKKVTKKPRKKKAVKKTK